uniref:katanin p80 WD40 repeat-containing subunit B1-like n=1 Tax=Styela clava TaxID=7725 RepID=UPI00193A5492|nr:katanin p80 WD40 repeat-containing subunit B1-like [Styela clava]
MASAKRSWLLQEFSAHTTALTTAALGKKSGRVMATGGEDGHVNLWAVGNPQYIMKFTGHSSSIEALSFNGTEELVCAGSRSGQLRIWNISEGKVTRNLTGHKAGVSCLDFHSIGEFVASGSLDHKVKMWDYRRKGCIFTYTGHEGAINALQFSPDGRWMTSGSDDGTCKIWDLTAGKLLHQFQDHGAPITCLQFHPNELLMATGGRDKTVKVYDVEQFEIVSSSKPQASAVLKVVFSESGHCLFSISQDMCHAYLWEPEPRTTDSFMVKWGRPDDVVISNRQLISATFSQNLVSNYVVDLTQVRTAAFEIPNSALPFQPPPTAVSPFSRPSHVTHRPPTSCATNAVKSENKNDKKDRMPVPPAESQVNQNNNFNIGEDRPLQVDEKEVFNPKSTLTRSPSGGRPTSISVNKPEHYNRNVKPTPSPHQASNILPHLTPEPASKNDKFQPEKDQPSKSVATNSTPSQPVRLNYGRVSPIEDVPTRDQNIPEKLEKKRSSPDTFVSSNNNVSVNPLEESRLSTIVPAQREDPVGLDMNAFLPAKKEPIIGKTEENITDTEAVATIKRGFESMRLVLTARHKNLEIVRAMWTGGDVMTSMNTAIRMKDQALLVDMLSVLNSKTSLWNLDLCQVMLPEIHDLLSSKYETYVTAACGALKIVLRNFGPLIKSNISAPPNSAVDLSREERYKKCFSCHESVVQIRTIIEKKIQQPGKAGSNFRELNILISSTLD